MFHQKSRCFYTQIWKLWALVYHRNSSMSSNKIDIFIGKIAYTARMFRHGETLLLRHARRIVQHRDRTRRGNSAFPFHFVFRIGSCVFSFRAHISSWSRTRDTTLICGLNHRWNRTIVNFWELSHWHLSMCKHCLTGTFSYVSTVSLVPLFKSTLSQGHSPYVTCMHTATPLLVNKIWTDPTWPVGGNSLCCCWHSWVLGFTRRVLPQFCMLDSWQLTVRFWM